MINLNYYSNACANGGLIRLNKYVSRFHARYIINFFISIRILLSIFYETSDVTFKKEFTLETKHALAVKSMNRQAEVGILHMHRVGLHYSFLSLLLPLYLSLSLLLAQQQQASIDSPSHPSAFPYPYRHSISELTGTFTSQIISCTLLNLDHNSCSCLTRALVGFHLPLWHFWQLIRYYW
jgi:hypothetical protein